MQIKAKKLKRFEKKKQKKLERFLDCSSRKKTGDN